MSNRQPPMEVNRLNLDEKKPPSYLRHSVMKTVYAFSNSCVPVKNACRLLEELNVTQPTLSHHMKILCDSRIVVGRKEENGHTIRFLPREQNTQLSV